MLQFFLTLTLLLPAAEKATAKIEFRGVPAREALRQVGEAAGARVILARQIPPELLEQDVRVELEHVTPEQAVRWIARLAGLEAITTTEGLYVLTPAQLAARGRKPEGGAPVLLAGRLRGDATRYDTTLPDEVVEHFELSGAIFWQDTPMTRVASDVSRIFGVDLIVEPSLAEEAPLLVWEEPETDLRRVCRFLSQQLSARVVYQDGVLYVTALLPSTSPADEASVDVPGSQPSFIEVGTRDQPVDEEPAEALPIATTALTSRPARSAEIAGPSSVEFAARKPAAEPASLPSSEQTNRPSRGNVAALPMTPKPEPVVVQPAPVKGPVATRPAPKVIFPAPPQAPLTSQEPVAKPDASSRTSAAPLRRRVAGSRLPAGRLQIDASVRDWEMLARRVESASGCVCRIKGTGRPFEPLEADGRVGQVLESLRLMGQLDFSYTRDAGGACVIEITPAPRS